MKEMHDPRRAFEALRDEEDAQMAASRPAGMTYDRSTHASPSDLMTLSAWIFAVVIIGLSFATGPWIPLGLIFVAAYVDTLVECHRERKSGIIRQTED